MLDLEFFQESIYGMYQELTNKEYEKPILCHVDWVYYSIDIKIAQQRI